MPAQSVRPANPGRVFAAFGGLTAAALVVSACAAAASTPGTSLNSFAAPSTASPAVTRTFIGDCCAPPTKRPYALVTARPGGPAAAPAASVRQTAAPTAADSMSQEGTGYFSKTVPANGTVAVPIDFEGSSWGSVVVYAKSNGLTVTFGGKALAAQKAAWLGDSAWSWGVTVDNPTNGDLTIKNTTGAPAETSGYVMIETRRHLIIGPSERFPHKGDQIGFDVTLSQATDADDVTASLVDEKGTSTTLSVTKVATGHWTGQATLTAVGPNVIRVSTTGSRFRGATTEVDVAAAIVTVSSTFEEKVVDSDQDGLIDELDLTPTITVPVAGKYMANATLVDLSGAEVTSDLDGEIDLVAGSQPLKLRFGGIYIYKAARWGPYTLHVTVVHDTTTTTIELDDAKLGETAAYDYMQFQRNLIAFDPKSIVATPIDTNGDGLYEQLDLTGTVTVETPGLYQINTSLYADKPWEHISMASTSAQLTEGSNTFRLVFKGADIAKSGRDGPYVESGLLCYLESDPADAPFMSVPNYTTAAYTASQFAK